MDPIDHHEKAPEALDPQIYEFTSETARSTITPDIEYAGTPSLEDEPVNIEDRKEQKGESVWYDLREERRKTSTDFLSGEL